MGTPAVALDDVIGDLEAEHRELDALVSDLDERAWDRLTPADPWTVRDQIGHLAFFDEAATEAITDPDRFAAKAHALMNAEGDPMEAHLRRGRAMEPGAVLAWWRQGRTRYVAAARTLDAGERVPWYGPPMGALSFVSARLMETWAHGQDVADTLGTPRLPTSRLRHVAHLGVRARPFSYVVRGLDVPSDEVRVELAGPGGEHWEWGPPDAAGGVVRGDAVDFCLVVTQRRHVDDTALAVTGASAAEWMAIAQAFAGPPGPGRPPTV
jgi:uncharacterized protein (TIGR03084 family)